MTSSRVFLCCRFRKYGSTGVAFLFVMVMMIPTPCFAQDAVGTFDYDGIERLYHVYLPEDYQPNMPLVLVLHGYNAHPPWMGNYTRIHEYADSLGFIVVYPRGSFATYWGWNAGLRDHAWATQDTTSDDVGYLCALIDTLHANYAVDLNRVYCCGWSMGGEMTYRMAIERGYRFAAFASVAGKLNDVSVAGGIPDRPFPILHFHGTNDAIEMYGPGGGNLWTVDSVVNYWQEKNECSLPPDTVALPDLDPTDGSTVEKIIWSNCADSTQLQFYKITGGSHSWPGGTSGMFTSAGRITRDVSASAEILDFFSNYRIKAEFSASTGSLDFDTVDIDGSKTDSITVTNTGTHTLHVAYASSDNVPLILTPPNAVIPPGDSIKFSITVNPHCFGDFSGDVVFHNNGVSSPDTISLTGFAYSSDLSVCPQNINYGNVRLGETGYDTAYIANPLGTLGSIDSVISDNPLFTVSLTSDTILPMDWASVPIAFTPNSIGEEQGTIVFYSWDMSVPDTVFVSGVGVQGAFSMDHDSYDFGDVIVGTFAGKIINVMNEGVGTIQINSITTDNGVFSVPPAIDTLHPGEGAFFNVKFTPTGPSSQTGHIIIEHDAPTSPDTLFVSGRGLIQLSLDSGWNMVSLPALVPDHHKAVIFPDSASPAYRYAGDYEIEDTLAEGRGYWIKFPEYRAPLFSGPPYETDTIPVRAGWNMIGATSYPLPVAEIGSIPGGITTTEFFTYETAGESYVTSDTLSPGIAYWVKTDKEGQFIYLRSPSTLRKNALIEIVPGDDLPPPPPEGGEQAASRVPLTFALHQNYPNPFNPITRINYALPTTSRVTLTLYSVLGSEITVLLDEVQDAGYKTVSFDASSLPSGVYFYRITAGTFSDTKKMLLIR